MGVTYDTFLHVLKGDQNVLTKAVDIKDDDLMLDETMSYSKITHITQRYLEIPVYKISDNSKVSINNKLIDKTNKRYQVDHASCEFLEFVLESGQYIVDENNVLIKTMQLNDLPDLSKCKRSGKKYYLDIAAVSKKNKVVEKEDEHKE